MSNEPDLRHEPDGAPTSQYEFIAETFIDVARLLALPRLQRSLEACTITRGTSDTMWEIRCTLTLSNMSLIWLREIMENITDGHMMAETVVLR